MMVYLKTDYFLIPLFILILALESTMGSLPVCAQNSLSDLAASLKLKEAQAWEHYDLAHHYLNRLDLDLAEAELEQAILADPDLKLIHRDYCLVSVLRLHLFRAVAEFMMATGLGEPMPFSPFEKAELDAKAAKLHYRKALTYGRANRWTSSINELKWSLTYAPENSAIERSLAFAYASSGQFDLAEEQYAQSFNTDPKDPYSHADFAYLLSQEGKQDKALSQITRASELSPKVAALHIDVAWFAEKQGDVGKARKELYEAIELSPKHASLWAHLARLWEKEGNVGEAKKAYEAALSLDPQLAEAKEAISKLKQ